MSSLDRGLATAAAYIALAFSVSTVPAAAHAAGTTFAAQRAYRQTLASYRKSVEAYRERRAHAAAEALAARLAYAHQLALYRHRQYLANASAAARLAAKLQHLYGHASAPSVAAHRAPAPVVAHRAPAPRPHIAQVANPRHVAFARLPKPPAVEPNGHPSPPPLHWYGWGAQ